MTDGGLLGTPDRDWQLYGDCPACGVAAGERCINRRSRTGLRWVHDDRPVMTPAIMRGVPNTPGTPRRTIRVSDALWEAAQAKAAERGEDLSSVIRKALERYVRRR